MESKIGKRIAIVVKTNDIDYDDRVRKVALALSKHYYVKIFAVIDNNSRFCGKSKYGVDLEVIKLRSRDFLPQAKFLLVKSIDFYLSVIFKIRKFDAFWYNEEKTFLFPLFASNNQIFVWDQHEVPLLFCKGFRRKIFQLIEQKAQRIFHANIERIEYLKSIQLIKNIMKHSVIHNYPDNTFINSIFIPSCYNSFKDWLGTDKYIYIQGLAVKERMPYNTISSILEASTYKIIVVGSVDRDELLKLRSKYVNLNNRVFFAGMVKQLEIPLLLRYAQFSIILYKKCDANNRYCEANRMYQAIALGVPVIVGNNESMESIVKDKFGIVLNSDGSDFDDLKMSIIMMNDNLPFFKHTCCLHSKEFVWNDDMVDTKWLF